MWDLTLRGLFSGFSKLSRRRISLNGASFLDVFHENPWKSLDTHI